MKFSARLAAVSPRAALVAAALFSAFMLGGALIGQYGFDLYPCELCLYQRYPYVAVAALALPAAFLAGPRLQCAALLLCAALFLGNAGLAFYHSGVEFGWFPGPSGCTSASGGGETLEELRAQILNAPLVSCDQAMGYVFGLSLAAWNALLAALAGLSLLAWFFLRRKRA